MTSLRLTDWPGKSDKEGRRHPALWHMLDVAAVARRLWGRSALSGLPAAWREAILFLVALHDLGKVSCAFRRQIEVGAPPPDACRHWQLTAWLLERHEGRLAGLLGGSPVARQVLGAAVAGHHGRPPATDPRAQDRRKEAIGPEAVAAAGEAIDLLAPLFPDRSLDGMDEAEAKRLSWLVSGLTVEADWIGSNSAWFEFAAPDLGIDAYWACALDRAAAAVAEAGLARSAPAILSPEALLGGPLRPMQRAVAEVALPDGPCLALVEDATGAGKTEAALILAHRMIRMGKGGGLYLALPTMATADAMFARLRPMLGRMFEGEPSLALLHGKRMLSEGFAEVRANAVSRGDRP